MTAVQSFVRHHTVLTFYLLTFAISWGGVLFIIGGPGAFPGSDEHVSRLYPLVLLTWFAGPSLAGIIVISLSDGKAGFRDLVVRLTAWRVGARWYAAAVLTGPLQFLVLLLPLSLIYTELLPGIFTTNDPLSQLILGLVAGYLFGGFLEELGWTGLAVPKLRQRYGPIHTALIVGVLHGALHMSIIFWMSGSAIGSLPVIAFFIIRGVDLLVGQLPAFRILMVWVYERTGSLLVAMLMHGSLSASMLILGPVTATGVIFLIYIVGSSLLAWTVVGIVAIIGARHTRSAVAPAASGVS